MSLVVMGQIRDVTRSYPGRLADRSRPQDVVRISKATFMQCSLLALVLTSLVAEASGAEYVVDVDARDNHSGNPVALFLEAGRYELTAVGPEEGGYFTARNAWGYTSNCVYSIGRCSRGWQHGVSLYANTDSLTPSQYVEATGRWFFDCSAYNDSVDNLRPEGETYLAWDTAETALSSMKTAVASKGGCSFDLSADAYVYFFDADSNHADNVGGVSYRVKSTSAVSDGGMSTSDSASEDDDAEIAGDVVDATVSAEELACNPSTEARYVQKIFIAYFGRPAAPAGLKYYADYIAMDPQAGKLTLFDDLFYSLEAEALYGQALLEAQLQQFYLFMFDRYALPAGIRYWSDEIAAGRFTIPASAAYIADAASGDDIKMLDAKQVAANKLTCALASAPADTLYGFQSNLAGARASLADVRSQEAAESYDGTAALQAIALSSNEGASSGSDGGTGTTTGMDTSTGTSEGTADTGSDAGEDVPAEGYCAGYDPNLADCQADQNFDPWIGGTGEVPYWIRNRLTEVFPFTLPARADAADTHYGYLQLTTGERKRDAATEDIFHMWFSETPNGPVLEGTNCEWYGTQAKTFFYWTQDETLQGDMCFLGEDSRLMYVNFETRCMEAFYSGTCNANNLRKSSRKYQFDVARRIRGY